MVAVCVWRKICKYSWIFCMTWTLLCDMMVKCQIQPIKNPAYWDGWSDWSACSVTCGQGVATRTRRCLTWHLGGVEPAEIWQCQGRDTRRKLCLTKECDSDLRDIEEDECLKLQTFNKFGEKQFWRSYEDTQCKRVCQEVRGREIRTISIAKDGTVCTLPNAKTAYCQQGLCKPTTTACDNGQGKQLRLDMCLICGGDNSSCYLVDGSFKYSFTEASNGLSIVVRVAQGSTFINVVKTGSTQNTLGLLNSDDIFVINTPDQPNQPGKYRAEGATWLYEGDWSTESFTATGPTVGSVTVLLTLSDKDQQVSYSFWAPKTFAPIRSTDSGGLLHRKNDKTEKATDIPVSGNSQAMGFLDSNLPTNQQTPEDEDIWNFLESEIKSTSVEKTSIPSFSDTSDKIDTRTVSSGQRINSDFSQERKEDNWKTISKSDRTRHNINTDSVIFLSSSENSFLEPDIFKPEPSQSTHSDSGSFSNEENNLDLQPRKPKDSKQVIPDHKGNLKPDIDLTGTSTESNSRRFQTIFNGNRRRGYDGSKYLSNNLIKETGYDVLGSPEWTGQGNSITRTPTVDSSVETNSITRHGGERPDYSKGNTDVTTNISNVNQRKIWTSPTPKRATSEEGRRVKKKRKKKRKRKKKQGRKAFSESVSDYCFPCKRANDRVEQFCASDFVSKVYINRRKVIENETRYDVTIMSSYRNRVSLMLREFIWVESKCKCPHLRAKRTYILMGRMESYTDREARLIIAPESYISGFSIGQERKIRRLGATMKCGD